MGFFSVATLAEIDSRGAYYITRLRSDLKVYLKEKDRWKEWDWESLGNQLKEGESVEVEHVYIGHERVYVPRLIFRRLTAEEWQKRLAYVRKKEYSAAKAGIENFTKWLAVHVAEIGVRVNAIAPGFFLTKQNEHLLKSPDGSYTERTEKILSHTPMRRLGKPEDLLGTLLWLVDDQMSGFVTGVTVPVDGGFLAYAGV